MNIGHASQKVYPIKFVQAAYDAKDKYKSTPDFIGTADEKLMFAQRAVEGDFEGFYISFIDPKKGTDETRKFKFPLKKLALHYKILERGVYKADGKEATSTLKVSSKDYQAFIAYQDSSILMSGVELNPLLHAFVISAVDINGNEKFFHRHLLDSDRYDLTSFVNKTKNGNFAFQLAFYRGHYIGALSSKNTYLMFMDGKTGVVSFADYSNYNVDTFKNHIYYIFEDLRKKKYDWYEITGMNLYSSESSIFNKKEFIIHLHKL